VSLPALWPLRASERLCAAASTLLAATAARVAAEAQAVYDGDAQAVASAYCVEVDARLEWRAALAAERAQRVTP